MIVRPAKLLLDIITYISPVISRLAVSPRPGVRGHRRGSTAPRGLGHGSARASRADRGLCSHAPSRLMRQISGECPMSPIGA